MLLFLYFTDANYTLPAKTEIKIFFRSTTRSGLLLSIINSTGPESVTVEQLDGQVRCDTVWLISEQLAFCHVLGVQD